jgi:hypothetical protein
MDEIAAATSVREVDHLWLEVRRDFAGDPKLSPSWRLSSPPNADSWPQTKARGEGRQWDRASLGDLRRAIERRRKELAG